MLALNMCRCKGERETDLTFEYGDQRRHPLGEGVGIPPEGSEQDNYENIWG